MAGSSFGTLFRITTWGESHGKGIGVVVDGCPAGLSLNEEDIQLFLDRRKPGQNKYTTQRQEADAVEILSGVFEGRTTGTPISLMVFNKDQRSKDYSDIASYYRPGHADYGFDQKYGFRDYRGGGRSSGRETIGRVAAGAIASKLLGELGIQVTAYTKSIGMVECDPAHFDRSRILNSKLYMPDEEAEERALLFLDECIEKQTSSGGMVECLVEHMKPGIGEPVFDKLDACLGKALFSIGAVKAVEIGDGLAVSRSMGHENNDQFTELSPAPADASQTESGTRRAQKAANHAGGILGGISDGSNILIRAAFKPTPSISRAQTALFQDGTCHEIRIKGRHDPIIVPRAVVVVEAMTAITILDLLLWNMTATLDKLHRIYD
ncbi:MAG: chorismate synthase [Lachnospiraceae bacterium]|nr:chorismate synthase [Lachnospiraceae bacterium]